MTTAHSTQSPHSQSASRKRARAASVAPTDGVPVRLKQDFEEQHKGISIYTSPIQVFSYFIMFVYYEARPAVVFFYDKGLVTSGLFITVASMILGAYQIQGPHQQMLRHLGQAMVWYAYWVLLGVASAIGLGTGLHTFLLFLGPYIAEVTRAAYLCNSTNLLTRDLGSFRLQCLHGASGADILTTTAFSSSASDVITVSLWRIYCSVFWESFAWGAGTALGELPPYFVARAVALSGKKKGALADFEELLEKPEERRTFKEQLSLWIYGIVKRLGFFGILLFASIPNPLFDFAGIMCGGFLVPFATFFGATFVGKACIKASFQSMIVILAFSNDTLNLFLGAVQSKAPSMHFILERIIHEQTHMITAGYATTYTQKENAPVNIFGVAWNACLAFMMACFLISSVESLGLAYMRHMHQEGARHLEKAKTESQ